MTQRESHGVQFTTCPQCPGATIGQRGLARHMEQMHGVAPASRKKAVKLDRAAIAVLTEAATGTISEARLAYRTTIKSLIKKGLLTEALEITAAGRERV